MPELPLQYNLWEAKRLADSLGVTNPQLPGLLADRGIYSEVRSGLAYVLAEVIGQGDSTPLDSLYIKDAGGIVGTVWEDITDCLIPADRLTELAQSLPSGFAIILPFTSVSEAISTAGPRVVNVLPYHKRLAKGNGIKLAIIDGGFLGLAGERTEGNVPPAERTISKDCTGWFAPPEGDHGTNCLEVAYSFAPDATYYLYRATTAAERGTAVDDAIAKGVQIISNSSSMLNTGWSDDSGPACKYANRAADAGILFFTAAGNEAREHYQATFTDANANQWADLDDGTEEIEVRVGAGERIEFDLQWDRSTRPQTDYDLYLYRWDATANRFVKLAEASSWNSRFTSDAGAFETLIWTNTTGEAMSVYLGIRGDGSTEQFEVFGNAIPWRTNIVSVGSTASPSNSSRLRVIPVGAIDRLCYDPAARPLCLAANPNDPLEDYSAWGPTNGGLFSVTLTAPTEIPTGLRPGGFGGTSCATPAAAGAAAVLMNAMGSPTSLAVRKQMIDWAAASRDWPPVGRDKYYGYGAVFFKRVRIEMPVGAVEVIGKRPNGPTPVEAAVFGDPQTDVAAIDHSSVELWADSALSQSAPVQLYDVDGDQMLDAVYSFQLPVSTPLGPSEFGVAGRFVSGEPFAATDSADVEIDVLGVRPTDVAGDWSLGQNTPNPFRTPTTIEYRLPRAGPVSFEVYDLAGKHVATIARGVQLAGVHTVRWAGLSERGERLRAGIYLYRLSWNGHHMTRGMILLE